jgi:hypothetical protein
LFGKVGGLNWILGFCFIYLFCWFVSQNFLWQLFTF